MRTTSWSRRLRAALLVPAVLLLAGTAGPALAQEPDLSPGLRELAEVLNRIETQALEFEGLAHEIDDAQGFLDRQLGRGRVRADRKKALEVAKADLTAVREQLVEQHAGLVTLLGQGDQLLSELYAHTQKDPTSVAKVDAHARGESAGVTKDLAADQARAKAFRERVQKQCKAVGYRPPPKQQARGAQRGCPPAMPHRCPNGRCSPTEYCPDFPSEDAPNFGEMVDDGGYYEEGYGDESYQDEYWEDWYEGDYYGDESWDDEGEGPGEGHGGHGGKSPGGKSAVGGGRGLRLNLPGKGPKKNTRPPHRKLPRTSLPKPRLPKMTIPKGRSPLPRGLPPPTFAPPPIPKLGAPHSSPGLAPPPALGGGLPKATLPSRGAPPPPTKSAPTRVAPRVSPKLVSPTLKLPRR